MQTWFWFIVDKVEPTKITQKPINKDVKEGTKVKFEATVKGTPKPEVSWFKNEVKLEPTDRITIDTKEVNIILELISYGTYTKGW